MRQRTRTLVAILATALLLMTLVLANSAGVHADSGSFPTTGDFNGMSISYSFSGGTATSSSDSSGFTTSRTIKGTLGTGQLSVSGSASQKWGFGANLSVRVWAGSEQKTFTQYIKTKGSQNFSLSVPIPANATSGGFTIDMTGDYNVGTRGLVVSGTFTGSGAGAAPTAAPTPVPTATPPQPTAVPPTPTATPKPGKPALKVAVQAPDSVNAGESITYRIEVSNAGDGAAPDTWFKWYARWDSAAEALFTQSGSPLSCRVVSRGTAPEIMCGPGTLQPGQSATAEVTLQAPADATSVGGEVLAQAACPGDSCYATWSGKTSIAELIPCTLSLEDQVRKSNELYLKSLGGSCLGKVVSLGDPSTFAAAMADVSVSVNEEGTNSYTPNWIFAGGEMVLRQPPCQGGKIDLGSGIHETAHHEMIHRLEHINGDFDSPHKDLPGYADRNADYVTAIKGQLARMSGLEKQAKGGASAAQLQRVWQDIQRSFVRGAASDNPNWPIPDLARLQEMTGFRARLDEIKQVYLSGCAGEEMRQAVLAAGDPPPFEFIPPTGLTVGAPADEPPVDPSLVTPPGSPPPPGTEDIPEGGTPIGF